MLDTQMPTKRDYVEEATPTELTLRDKIALEAMDDDIDRHRGWYRPLEGGLTRKPMYTIEEARYRYADAMLAARGDVK